MTAVKEIPRVLNSKNIAEAISDYLHLLNKVPFIIEATNALELLSKIKRQKIEVGPYPEVTFFEAANRIMTDLTILFGVKELLEGRIPEISFDQYKVELGNENNNDHDIEASREGSKLIGEAFNVADTFFHVKKSSSLRKLRGSADKNTIVLLMYNVDAVKETYVPKRFENEYHLPVKVVLPQNV